MPSTIQPALHKQNNIPWNQNTGNIFKLIQENNQGHRLGAKKRKGDQTQEEEVRVFEKIIFQAQTTPATVSNETDNNSLKTGSKRADINNVPSPNYNKAINMRIHRT